MWAPILEKAWAKVKGGYERSGQGGFTQNGLRAVIGSPIFSYVIKEIGTSDGLDSVNAVWEEI
jgi:hypothetical protein